MKGSHLFEGKLYKVPVREKEPDRTKITTELSMRLFELHHLDPTRAISFLQLMVKLYRLNPWVYHLALEQLAGNMKAGQPLTMQAVTGKHSFHSKQAEQQRQNRALNLVELYFPDVAKAIRVTLNRQKPIPSEPEAKRKHTLEQLKR